MYRTSNYICNNYPSTPRTFTEEDGDYKIEVEIGPKHHYSRFYNRFDHRGYCTIRNYKLKSDGITYRKTLQNTSFDVYFRLRERYNGVDEYSQQPIGGNNKLIRCRTFYHTNYSHNGYKYYCGYSLFDIAISASTNHISIIRNTN